MKIVTRAFLAVALAAGALAFTAAAASASLACSGDVCWHVHHAYHYPPSAAVIIHPDTWHHGPKIVIREHSGRGYWHHDHWVHW